MNGELFLMGQPEETSLRQCHLGEDQSEVRDKRRDSAPGTGDRVCKAL